MRSYYHGYLIESKDCFWINSNSLVISKSYYDGTKKIIDLERNTSNIEKNYGVIKKRMFSARFLL